MSVKDDPSRPIVEPWAARRIAFHGSAPWVEWARGTIARACERHCLHIEVLALPETLTPAAINDAKTSSQIVLLIEDPAQMIARRATASPFLEALRAAVATAAAACELARHHGAKAIEVDTDNEFRTDSLLNLLGIPHCDAVSEAVVEVSDTGLSTLSPGENLDTVEACLTPLLQGVSLKRPISLRWPREVFFTGDQPGMSLPETFDIAGAARVLSYGPYFPLPTGRWRVVPMLGFSRHVGRMPFLIEVVCEGVIHRAYFEARRAGIFSLPFELELDANRMGIPVEIRLVSQDSALEGQVALVEVGFEEAACCSQISLDP
ncbi:MAG: hypothetical protein AAB403_15155 [Planctomycetota bacterium]